MFFNKKELSFHAKPDRPDPVLAKHLQEIIGGQFGEMSVAMQLGAPVASLSSQMNLLFPQESPTLFRTIGANF